MIKNQLLPIVVDLDVNREQLGEDGIYFERLNHIDLANILKEYKNQNCQYDYQSKRKEFANQFYNILN